MKERFLSRGNIVLFLITMGVTLFTAWCVTLCGADRITTVVAAQMGGTAIIVAIGCLVKMFGMAFVGADSGILGTMAGTVAVLILF